MSEVVSTQSLNTAFAHVYASRQKDSANSYIWSLSLKWPESRARLQRQLLSGEYQLSPIMSYYIDGAYYTRWCSLDAVVLKAVSAVLTPIFIETLDKRCVHLTR